MGPRLRFVQLRGAADRALHLGVGERTARAAHRRSPCRRRRRARGRRSGSRSPCRARRTAPSCPRLFNADMTTSITPNFSSTEMPLVGSSSSRTRGGRPPPWRCRGACAPRGSACACCRGRRDAEQLERRSAPLRGQVVAGRFSGASTRAKTPSRPAFAAPPAAHVLEHGERGKDLRHLERARDAEARDLARGRPVMSRSSNRMVPLVGRRWPVIMLMKVVLPAPLAPMMPHGLLRGRRA